MKESLNVKNVRRKPEKQKLVIKISEDKEREIQVSTQTTFWSADGRQVSAQEFLQELYGELPLFFRSEDELRKIWSQPVQTRTTV